MSMGINYPMCCVFSTKEDADLANQRLTEAMRIQNPNLSDWAIPEQRVADGKMVVPAT